MRIRVYHADGREELHEVREPKTYRDFTELLHDRFIVPPIEHVTVFWSFDGEEPRYLDAFVCENGIIVGLPVNRKATEIYRNNVRVHDPAEYDPARMSVIVGTMVLFEEKVWK